MPPEWVNFWSRITSYDPWILAAEWLLISLAVWAVLRFARGTRGARIMKGAALLLLLGYTVVNLLAGRLGLDRISVLYDKFAIGALFALAIVFQPELRRALLRIGETRLFRAWSSQVIGMVDRVVAAAQYLSENKIGALMAIECETGLTGLVETGVRLDAEVTPDLLTTLFWPGSSLHDMGVIIQQGRIAAAGCQFPLAESGELPQNLGSRHRAALGLSQETDALIIVVSEETGTITLAYRGQLIRPLSPELLRRRLLEQLAPSLANQPAEVKVAGPSALDALDPLDALAPADGSAKPSRPAAPLVDRPARGEESASPADTLPAGSEMK